MKKLLKKSIYLLLFICCSIFLLQDVKAESYQIIKLRNANTTCNIYASNNRNTILTYINPQFSRDVPLLSKSGSYYKIKVSGVTGWIHKNEGCFGSVVNVDDLDYYTFKTGSASLRGLDVSRYQVVDGKMYFGLVYGNYITYNIGYTDVPVGLKNKTIYYSYDGVYYYTSYKKMLKDYKNNTYVNAANFKNPYYDYYQYLPLRSKTNISNTAFNKYLLSKEPKSKNDFPKTIKKFSRTCNSSDYKKLSYEGRYSAVYNKGSNFISQQKSHNVNAGILYGITLNESANGTSNLSRYYKNPFGWGAYDSCPNKATIYEDINSSISKYFNNMSKTYANPIADTGGKGSHLGNKKSGANVKYASDPHWGYKNAFNYRKIDEYAKKVDKNKYKIGIINPTKTNMNENIYVYKTASTKTKLPFYYERNGSSVIILGSSGSYYKIQNDTSPNAGVGYIQKSKVVVANEPAEVVQTTPQKITSVEYKSGYLWGKNNNGQIGNGKTTDVSEKNKVKLSSLLPSSEVVSKVYVHKNNNVFVLTKSGNVYGSGSNYYGQRSHTSTKNKFNRINPKNYKVSEIKVSDYRLRMKIKDRSNDYMYVGKNSFNIETRTYNKTSKYPILVRFNNQSSAVYSWEFDYTINKQKVRYKYTNGKITNKITYTYYDTKELKHKRDYKMKDMKRTYLKKTTYYKSKRTASVYEYRYVGDKLKSTSKTKAYRYKTLYKNNKPSVSYLNYYSKDGKLLATKKVKLRK